MTATISQLACPVCGTSGDGPIYERSDGLSISSTARIIAAPTCVHVCRSCAHVHTSPLEDIDGYYDTDYNVHLDGDTDDLYELRNGLPVYRTQHQAVVALDKLILPHGAAVLDYGSGKASSLRAMAQARPDVRPFVFDVSANYGDHWSEFVPPERQATYRTPQSWEGSFDAVLSFFALEHVADPRSFLVTLRRLCKPGGAVHVVVPNVRRNVGDFIVVDHVNHFMPSSIRLAFEAAGFSDIRIDEEAHTAAYVIDAIRRDGAANPAAQLRSEQYVAEAERLAQMWSRAGERVRAFEATIARQRPAAIYGSGFYGVFIASALADRSSLVYFLDQNPHQRSKRIVDRPVIAPERLDDDVDVLYVGLNPARARDIIAGVADVHRRTRDIFFLE